MESAPVQPSIFCRVHCTNLLHWFIDCQCQYIKNYRHAVMWTFIISRIGFIVLNWIIYLLRLFVVLHSTGACGNMAANVALYKWAIPEVWQTMKRVSVATSRQCHILLIPARWLNSTVVYNIYTLQTKLPSIGWRHTAHRSLRDITLYYITCFTVPTYLLMLTACDGRGGDRSGVLQRLAASGDEGRWNDFRAQRPAHH